MRVAYYSPLPPERSGIADYSALLLPALERLVQVEVVPRGRTRPPEADVSLYHVGNDPDAHSWIVDALRRRPGLVVLHDFVLHHLMAGLTLGRRDAPAYLAALERDAGVPGRLLGHGVLEGRVPPLWETRPEDFPLAGEVLDRALGLVVHSGYVEARVRELGYDGPIWRIPHPAWPVPDVEPAQIAGGPLFGCFGNLNPSKRIPQLLRAFEAVRARHPTATLLLVGAESPGFDLDRYGLPDGVVREPYVGAERLWALMAACDACVALRRPTMGETSGSVVRALSLGKPLVVSDVGWFAELPDEVALKVPVDGEEMEILAASLELLAASEAVRRTMGAAARGLAQREHDLGSVAERYVAALEESAGGGIVEERVLREIAAAAAEVGLGETGEVAERLAEAGIARDAPAPVPTPPRGRPRVPVWPLLGLLVLVSAAVRIVLSRQTVAPWIMVDELVYSELAKSFGATGHFLIRGEDHGAYGYVYPALIAPAFRWVASVPHAYGVAKGIGAVVMSLAAIPAYFLARRVLTPAWALSAAVLSVAIPSMVYTSVLMTETVFYPVFLGVALALVLTLERPTRARQLALLALCALAFVTRAQAVVLVPVVVAAPLLLAWIERRPLRHLRPYRFLYALVGAAVLGVLLVQLGRGRSPFDVFGAYSATGHLHYGFVASLRWMLLHVAELDLYVGVAPFAALLLLLLGARRADAALRAFVAAAASLIVFLVLQVGIFASLPSVSRIEERNVFYLVPLFLIALLAWIDRGLPRPARATALAVLLAGALPGLIPYRELIGVPAESDTLMLLPWWFLSEHGLAPAYVPTAIVACALLISVAVLLLPRRAALALPVFVLVYFALAQQPIVSFDHGFRAASVGALFQGNRVGDRDWIDEQLGRDARVGVLWTGNTHPFVVWENEFFNRSVGPVYALGRRVDGLPETKVFVRRRSGLVTDARGRPIDVPYLLTDESFEPAGELLIRDRERRTGLWRVDPPLRTTTRLEGLYPQDTWSGPTMRYTRLACRGGWVTLTVQSDHFVFTKPQTLTIASGSYRRQRTIPTVGPQDVTVPLTPAGGRCTVVFTVSPTAVPAKVRPGETTDTRRLGLHFFDFRYRPPR